MENNRAWMAIWTIVAVMGLIAFICGAEHHFLTFGLAMAFICGEGFEFKQKKNAREAGRKS